MSDIARGLIKEPGAEDALHYARRVRRLAVSYVALFALSLLGIGLLVWRAQLFVTLAQRSNVETLTLAFLMVFFGYLVTLSAPGVWGVLQIARHSLTGDWASRQQRKMRALGPSAGRPTVADLNVIVELEGQPGAAFELAVADSAGRMGRLRVDGARLSYLADHRDGSNDVLAYLERQVARVLGDRGQSVDVDIVAWKKIDDEDAERYHGMVEFARNLERQLGGGALWPKVQLTAADHQELENRLRSICPALRDEGFLPQWDYQAEHKLPIIPEPLGLISLNRTEQRVDPIASMGCAVLVVLVVVMILALFIVVPPWVPGL